MNKSWKCLKMTESEIKLLSVKDILSVFAILSALGSIMSAIAFVPYAGITEVNAIGSQSVSITLGLAAITFALLSFSYKEE